MTMRAQDRATPPDYDRPRVVNPKEMVVPSPAELREARILLGITGAEAAEAVGVCPQTLSHWECGRRSPSADTLRELVRFYRQRADRRS